MTCHITAVCELSQGHNLRKSIYVLRISTEEKTKEGVPLLCGSYFQMVKELCQTQPQAYKTRSLLLNKYRDINVMLCCTSSHNQEPISSIIVLFIIVSFINSFIFQRQSLATDSRLVLNLVWQCRPASPFQCSCLRLLNTVIANMSHHTQLTYYLDKKKEFKMKVNTIITRCWQQLKKLLLGLKISKARKSSGDPQSDGDTAK